MEKKRLKYLLRFYCLCSEFVSDSWNEIDQILTLCCNAVRNRWGYNASFFFIRRWDGNYLQALIKEGKLFFVIVPTLWVHIEHYGFTNILKLLETLFYNYVLPHFHNNIFQLGSTIYVWKFCKNKSKYFVLIFSR